MHKTQARRVTLLCVRVFVISLIAGAALLTLYLVISGSSQPARAWECEDAGVQAQTAISGTILISPTVTTVGVGESVTVTVWLSDVADYYGIDFHLTFDPNVVYSAEVTPLDGAFDLSQSFIITKVMSGEVQYAVSNHNPAKPFTGTGRVCAITFQALAPISTTLHFTYVKGCTRDGDSLYPTREDGEIEVGGAVEITPTTDSATTPYAIQVYTLTLTNGGTTTDTFDITHIATDTENLPPSGQGPGFDEWVVVSSTNSIEVGSGLSATLHITIEIPERAGMWVTHTLTITATSQNHSTEAASTLTTWTGGYWDPGVFPLGGYVGCRCDFNYDSAVELLDLMEQIGEYGGQSPFHDFNHDDWVELLDLMFVIGKYGDTCSGP